MGAKLPRTLFGHAARVAEKKRRHLLGTRLPEHILITLRLLRRKKGGIFWARGLQGTLWSHCASCKRERAAPFGQNASRAHFGHAAPLAEKKRRHLWAQSFQGTIWSRRASCGKGKAPFGHNASRAHFGHAARLAKEKRRHLLEPKRFFRVIAPRLLHELVQNRPNRDRSVPPQEAERLQSVTEACRAKMRNASTSPQKPTEMLQRRPRTAPNRD